MANITFGVDLGDFGLLSNLYTGTLEYDSMVKDKKTNAIVEVTYRDSDTGNLIEMHGDNLKFSAPDKHHVQHHILAGGTVSSVMFTSAAGAEEGKDGDLIAITDAQYNASYLYKVGHAHLADLASAVLDGNDKIIGSSLSDYMLGGDGNDTIKGNAGFDWLIGNGGNDQLNGGKGGDVFFFGKGQAHDTVQDYQPGVDQIGLLTTDHLYHWQSGNNTVLQFIPHVEDPNPHHPAENAPDAMTIKGITNFDEITFYSAM